MIDQYEKLYFLRNHGISDKLSMGCDNKIVASALNISPTNWSGYASRNSNTVLPNKFDSILSKLYGFDHLWPEWRNGKIDDFQKKYLEHHQISESNKLLELKEDRRGVIINLPEDVVEKFIDTISRGVIDNYNMENSCTELNALDTSDDRFLCNRADITKRAIKYLDEKTSEQKVEQDWIDLFARNCEIVSDTDRKELWSQVLAMKINNPSKFSHKTIRIMQDLTTDQANKFRKLSDIIFDVDGVKLSIRLDHDTDKYLNFADLNYENLLELDEYGLVNVGHKGFVAKSGSTFTFFSKRFQAITKFKFRANPLTSAGSELYELTERNPSEAYFLEVVKMFDGKIGPIT